jgi:L-iditol 2-dehydrogenase
MKTVVIRAQRRVEILEEDVPKPRGDFALIKVRTAPMCTEFYRYRDGTESLCLGHEAAGEVVEVARPGRIKAGDRVVVMPQYPCGVCELCRQGDYIHCEHVVDPYAICGCATGKATYSQYTLKQDWLLLPIPDSMSTDEASMACCGLGASFGAVQTLEIGASDTVLVTGLGPVGLGAVINCRSRGARVLGLARNTFRAKLALELGAEAVLDPDDADSLQRLRALTGGRGVDKAIECSGGSAYQLSCIHGTRRKGRIAFVGESKDLTVQVSDDLIRNGLTLVGSWHWNLKDAPQMMATIAASAASIAKLATHTFPLTAAEEAFKLQMSGACGKVLLHPWD